VEARVLTNGKLLYARTFPTGDDALGMGGPVNERNCP
jgi:hypothetical protein